MREAHMICEKCNTRMFRVPRSLENDADVINPYWMCAECDHVQLVSYQIIFSRDGEQTNFILMSKDEWNKVGPLLAEHFNLFPIDEKRAGS